MNPSPGEWTLPADVVAQIQRLWDRGRILAASLAGETLFPLRLRFKYPTGRELSDRFEEVQRWLRKLDEGSKDIRGSGYTIIWQDTDHRQLGRNKVPTGIEVATEQDALRLIGKTRETENFHRLAGHTLAELPVLADWLMRRSMIVLKHADEWGKVLKVLIWVRERPRPGLYLRQLDIPGVDTKFIETRRGLLSELLDLVLPSDAVDSDLTGARNFEPRYGLRSKPALVRFRFLDPRLYMDGLSDISVPSEQFVQLRPQVKQVFITENEINGLAFPDVPGSLVIFGLGYGIDRLAEAEWLRNVDIHYWGDIDTHGFAILNRLRAVLPNAHSFLMDRETLSAHRDLWVHEDDPSKATLSRLTDKEQELYNDLLHDRLGERIRMEQERISFRFITMALSPLMDGGSERPQVRPG